MRLFNTNTKKLLMLDKSDLILAFDLQYKLINYFLNKKNFPEPFIKNKKKMWFTCEIKEWIKNYNPDLLYFIDDYLEEMKLSSV